MQIIDSLEPGGAERMAVNFANAFAEKEMFSGIIATRAEGSLHSSIDTEVEYLYLNRTKKVDIKAWSKAAAYLKGNKVTHIQAHGTSLFFAVLLKLTRPSLHIIWHDHLGNRPESKNGNFSIKILSLFVNKILVVNNELKEWAKEHLLCKKIAMLPNFAIMTNEVPITFLKGTNDKRIVCLANLKSPKNHLFVLKSFYESGIQELGWTLHLVGKDFNDLYSRKLKDFVKENELNRNIYFYGSCADTQHILKQAQAGILGSTYEGFPVVLLEYGLASLAVIATDVGYTSNLMQSDKTGWLIPSNDRESILNAFRDLANNPAKSNTLAFNLNAVVNANFSKEKVLQQLIDFLKN